MDTITLSHGLNDQLWDTGGRIYTDLLTGFGTALLGHSHPVIARALKKQVDRLWITARMDTEPAAEATGLVNQMLPEHLRCAGFYSTGMEAAEFAIRVVTRTTQRGELLGFERSMHGKSLASAALCWPNDSMPMEAVHRIPYFPQKEAAGILSAVRNELEGGRIGGVFLEPLQGSGGGYGGEPSFYRELQAMTREAGALLVVDEVLLGFYRTGHRFFHESLGLTPDLLLTGKTMANGFPVSCLSVRKDLDITGAMLPGSTYSENPLAMATVAATLRQMQEMDLPGMIQRIDGIVTSELSGLPAACQLRGSGAFWVITLPDASLTPTITAAMREDGVILSGAGTFIRLLPAATIDPDRLARACRTLLKHLKTHLS